MTWLYYLLEANLYLSIFYIGYCLFLKRETHYTLNRAYLLLSCVIAFALPFIQLGRLKHAEPPNTTAIIIENADFTNTKTPLIQAPTPAVFNWEDAIAYTYLLGGIILSTLLLVKLYKLFKLSRSRANVINQGYKIIYLHNSNTAFSFFNYLFIGTQTLQPATVIRHELVHIRQKHTADILFLELFKIINWFNPLVYLLQNSLKTLHEYIADEQTAAYEHDAITYSSFLLSNAYGLSGSTVTNSFFNYNLLKKRIIMLNQQRSGKLARLKYLITLPICAVLMCVSTLAFSKNYGWLDLAPLRTFAKAINDTTFLETPKLYVNDKGYLIDEKYYKVDGKKYYRTIISLKSGKELDLSPQFKPKKITLYKGHSTATGDEMILHNFGYKFPDAEVTKSTLRLPPDAPAAAPEPTVKTRQAKVTANNNLPVKVSVEAPGDTLKPDFNPFYKQLSQKIHYPSNDVLNKITGKVFASFTVDDNGKIREVGILRSPSSLMSSELARAITACGVLQGSKTGTTYVIPVNFFLSGYDGPATPLITLQQAGSMHNPENKRVYMNEVVVVAYAEKR